MPGWLAGARHVYSRPGEFKRYPALSNMNSATPESDLRKTSFTRTMFCAGAGAANIGHSVAAYSSFLTGLLIIPMIAWLALRPSLPTLIAAIASLSIFGFAYAFEVFTIFTGTIRDPAPQWLARQYKGLSVLATLLFIGLFLLLYFAFGFLVMRGTGMRPTITSGEPIVFHKLAKQSVTQNGQLVVFLNAPESGWGTPKDYVVARILSSAGDRLSVDGGNFIVNGEPQSAAAPDDTWPSVLTIPPSPDFVIVPDGSYFVIQDSPTGGYDSRVLSWLTNDRVIASRIWLLNPLRLFSTWTLRHDSA